MKALHPFVNVTVMLLVFPFLMLRDSIKARLTKACDHQLDDGWYLLKGICKKCGKELM